MRISPEEVTRIVHRLIQEWKTSGAARFKTTDEKIQFHLSEIFLKELRVEDDLNADVEKMLAKYEKEFQSGKLDRRKMSQMVKHQLAKERKIVL